MNIQMYSYTPLFLERSWINDVSTGQWAINVSRGTASLCRPYEHDLLHIRGTHISGYGCIASKLGEQGPPLSGIDVVRILLFYIRIPTALHTVLLTQEEKAEQHNDQHQWTNNDNNYYYKNNYSSDTNYNINKKNDDNKDDDDKDDEDEDKDDDKKDNNKWTKMQL
jgi:hypothetical protein